jgi:hypothetical protein
VVNVLAEKPKYDEMKMQANSLVAEIDA